MSRLENLGALCKSFERGVLLVGGLFIYQIVRRDIRPSRQKGVKTVSFVGKKLQILDYFFYNEHIGIINISSVLINCILF